MSALETFLTAVRDSRGMARRNALKNLRDYIKQSTTSELIDAIHKIYSVQLLRIIIEAGVNRELQLVITEWGAELIKSGKSA